MGPLSSQAASVALAEPARTSEDGLDFEPAALDALLGACAGYPYFIQVYGHAAWNVAEPPSLDSEEAAEAIRLGRRELDGDLYAGRWERSSERARRYMCAMAERGDAAVGSGDVATALGGHGAVSMVREQLIDDGLIYSPARGQVAFTVPGFADFIPPHASHVAGIAARRNVRYSCVLAGNGYRNSFSLLGTFLDNSVTPLRPRMGPDRGGGERLSPDRRPASMAA